MHTIYLLHISKYLYKHASIYINTHAIMCNAITIILNSLTQFKLFFQDEII